jgi:NADH:ubiquinone oxidoreductase subunit E
MSSGHPGLTNDFQEKGSPFNWSGENLKEIEIIKSKYPLERVQSAVMPLLYLAQKQNDNLAQH